MNQRMMDIGGMFRIDSAPGAGTRISLTYRWPANNGHAARLPAMN